MMYLVKLLPFVIGKFIEYDDHWECFLVLLSICDMVCSFEVHPDDPAKLAWLVKEKVTTHLLTDLTDQTAFAHLLTDRIDPFDSFTDHYH